MSLLLLTGGQGFTGKHLSQTAQSQGWQIHHLSANLTDAPAVHAEVQGLTPDYVLHLGAISSVTHADELAFYRVNVLGTINLLQALSKLPTPPKNVVLASSANVYGNALNSPITEISQPAPINHYATSKLAMEYMALTYTQQLPIVLARPFNYTGVGHDERFVIPKIIHHFAERAPELMLGNLQVEREFNDVRTVCDSYLKLLQYGKSGEIYNICSGQTVSLQSVLNILADLTGHQSLVTVNPAFVRANEVYKLCGDPSKLETCIGRIQHTSLIETLSWMLAHA